MIFKRCSIGAIALALAAGPAAAHDPASLYDACFARTYDAAHLARHPEQRVSAITVYFQNFADTLLAAVSYTLRYGPRFGFSGDCHEGIEGGFVCQACASDSCANEGESFRILWPGGDSIELLNDTTGVVGENPDGGRDYLRAGGEPEAFVMRRGSSADCAW
jgi:hypothetical protein